MPGLGMAAGTSVRGVSRFTVVAAAVQQRLGALEPAVFARTLVWAFPELSRLRAANSGEARAEPKDNNDTISPSITDAGRTTFRFG